MSCTCWLASAELSRGLKPLAPSQPRDDLVRIDQSSVDHLQPSRRKTDDLSANPSHERGDAKAPLLLSLGPDHESDGACGAGKRQSVDNPDSSVGCTSSGISSSRARRVSPQWETRPSRTKSRVRGDGDPAIPATHSQSHAAV